MFVPYDLPHPPAVLNDMEGLQLSTDDVQRIVAMAHTDCSTSGSGEGEALLLRKIVEQFRPRAQAPLREWPGGAAPTPHEMGLDTTDGLVAVDVKGSPAAPRTVVSEAATSLKEASSAARAKGRG